MQLKKESSSLKKDEYSKSELKLPKLLNNHSSQDYLSNRIGSTNIDHSKTQQSINASILNGSILNPTTTTTKSHRARYFLDSSIISEQTGRDIAMKMEYININEQKKIMQPEFEKEFDLNTLLAVKNDKDKSNVNQHYMLQDDLKTYFHVEKKPVYAKINTSGKSFPLKVKVTATEGTYDFFFSFFDPFPDKDRTAEEFPQRKEHLYKFLKPKTFSQWAYFCISSKNTAKIELKVWFTNQNLEKFRFNNKQQTKLNGENQMLSLKEKLKIELSEQEKKALHIEVSMELIINYLNYHHFGNNKLLFLINQKVQIKQRRFLKLKMQDQQILDRNKELAANIKLLQKKKEFDHIIHNQRCEEVIRKNISIQLLNYQDKYQKYISKIINHQLNLDKIKRQKFQTEVNNLSYSWLPFIYLVKIADRFQDMIYMSKLSSIFKGRQQRAFQELVRTFRGKKLEMKPYLNEKQRLMSEIILSMNVKAKQIKKIKKKMAAKVLIYFVQNQKQNHILNTIVAYSKKMVAQVTLIQKKRRSSINLHLFISMKMLDGLCEQLKDEDFKRKQLQIAPSDVVEISFYINYLKKKDKAILVKAFLKAVKEEFRHHLMLSTGRIQPVSDEDRLFLEMETKNMKRQLSELLDIHQINNKNLGDEIIEAKEEIEEQEEKMKQEQNNAEIDDEDNQLISNQKQSKYKLSQTDWNLLEVLRNTQVKIRVIQSRSLMKSLLLQKLEDIKKEREDGLNQLYLTQQQNN